MKYAKKCSDIFVKMLRMLRMQQLAHFKHNIDGDINSLD